MTPLIRSSSSVITTSSSPSPCTRTTTVPALMSTASALYASTPRARWLTCDSF